jgi:hypothetical protein
LALVYDGTGAPNKKENANTTYFKMGIANNPIPINNGIKNDCLRFLLNMLYENNKSPVIPKTNGRYTRKSPSN